MSKGHGDIATFDQVDDQQGGFAQLESIARSRTELLAGSSGRGFCWLTGKPRRSMRLARPWDCMLKLSNAALRRAKAEGALAGAGRACPPGQGADDHRRGQDVGGGVGLPEGEGTGYPHEVWTTRLLARHAREHGPAEGHSCLSGLAQGTVCKILDAQRGEAAQGALLPRTPGPEFKAKMAQVLCVYSKVNVLKKAAATAAKKNKKPSEAVTVISYDEKPGIQRLQRPPRTCRQSLACTRPSPASLNTSATARSALLAGIDLVTGKVHALVKDRHRSREFIDFLKLVDGRLSDAHRDPPDPRQSFRPHLQRDECMARRPDRVASSSPSRPSTAHG